MSGYEISDIILAVATLVAALSAAVVAIRASGKLNRVGEAVDGQTKHLVALTAASSYAAGAAAVGAPPALPPAGVGGVVGAPPADPGHVGNPPTSV